MTVTIGGIISWLAPILSTIIITAATASINAQAKKHERISEERHQETEKKRKVEAEWRAEIASQMQEQDKRINTILHAQCTQMRSDIIHKCHRYLDDLGRASTEEKEALNAEHEDYTAMCEANHIVNNFVDRLVERVMQLPEREI
jgi:hypothetical protein